MYPFITKVFLHLEITTEMIRGGFIGKYRRQERRNVGRQKGRKGRTEGGRREREREIYFQKGKCRQVRSSITESL